MQEPSLPGPQGLDATAVTLSGFTLDLASPFARAEWIVICDAQGAARGARISGGVEIYRDAIERLFASSLKERSIARWNKEKSRIEARRERRLGAILIASGPDPDPDPQVILEALTAQALDDLESLLPSGFLARAAFAGLEALSADRLRQTADLWLKPLLEGRRNLDLPGHRFAEAAMNALDWSEKQALDRSAPREFASPAGTRHPIDYSGDEAPSVEVRVQALFGLDAHPMIGATPLLLKLTSPAGRPIQSTRDLPGFWRGSWADVAKEMKGRYPRHRWPDQPWLEKPSLKTKNAFNRQ